MKKIILLSLISFIALQSCAQPKKYPEFEKEFNHVVKLLDSTFNRQFGIALSVVKDDEMIYEYHDGYASITGKKEVTPKTRFYLGSITKTFMALTALKLHQKGKIDLDKNLTHYFKEIAFDSVPHIDKIKVRHLLSHSAGISNDFLGTRIAYLGNYDTNILLESLAKYTKANDVGFGEFRYSNINYNILQLIIERELGKTWKEVICEEVFVPLKMKSTSAYLDDMRDKSIPLAAPYVQTKLDGTLEETEVQKTDKSLHGAGGHYSTTRDMARWIMLHLNNGNLDGKQVIPQEMISDSHKPQVAQQNSYIDMGRTGYGYGWQIGKDRDGDVNVHHFGAYVGYHAEVILQHQNNLGVAVMTNEGNGPGIITAFILSSFVTDYFTNPENILERYKTMIGRYAKMAQGQFDSMKSNKEKITKRQWQLELPFKSYSGKYNSDELGTIELMYDEQNGFTMNHGVLTLKKITPFTKPNTMRLEFFGSGYILKFNIKGTNVVNMIYDSVVYKKVQK